MSSTKHREKPQKSNDSAPDEKVRILCLHGYRQNGNTFKSKIGKKKIQYLFMSETLVRNLEMNS